MYFLIDMGHLISMCASPMFFVRWCGLPVLSSLSRRGASGLVSAYRRRGAAAFLRRRAAVSLPERPAAILRSRAVLIYCAEGRCPAARKSSEAFLRRRAVLLFRAEKKRGSFAQKYCRVFLRLRAMLSFGAEKQSRLSAQKKRAPLRRKTEASLRIRSC